MDSCMCNIHKNKWSTIIKGNFHDNPLLDRHASQARISFQDSIRCRDKYSGEVSFEMTAHDLEVRVSSRFVFQCSLEAKDSNGEQLLNYLGTSNENSIQSQALHVDGDNYRYPRAKRTSQHRHCFSLKIKRDSNDDNANKLWNKHIENLEFYLELLFDAEVVKGRLHEEEKTCYGSCRDQRVHMDQLMKAMKNLSDEESKQTVTIRVGDDVEIVNKVILSTFSPVFERMFDTPMKEQQEESVTIEDLDIKVVQNIISFAYTGKVGKINEGELLELYYASKKYQISGLLKHCSDLILLQISCNNVCSLLQFAENYEDDRLKSGVLSYMILNIHSVLELEEWRKLLHEKPKLALQVFESPYKEQITENEDQMKELNKRYIAARTLRGCDPDSEEYDGGFSCRELDFCPSDSD